MFKRSKYYKVSNEDFIQAIKTSFSIKEVLTKLNMNCVGAAYKTFKLRVAELNLDTSHFLGSAHLRGKHHNWNPKYPLDTILVENSSYTNTCRLKERLLKEQLIKYICSQCGICNWNGQRLSLHLDHINGVNNDHRLENLRLLCPNCHSLTPTYAGKNSRFKS